MKGLQLDQDLQENLKRLISYISEDDNLWDLALDKKGVKIFKKFEEGNPIIVLRTVAQISDCPLDELFELIYDAKGRQSWDKVLKNFTSMDCENENIDYLYFFVDIGFGVSKRDFITKRVWLRDTP
jgi:hypothetical protein